MAEMAALKALREPINNVLNVFVADFVEYGLFCFVFETVDGDFVQHVELGVSHVVESSLVRFLRHCNAVQGPLRKSPTGRTMRCLGG